MRFNDFSTTAPSMHIFVFSFNRGRFLENCLSSIYRCAPGLSVSVLDDGSTDRFTLTLLKQLERTIEVLRPASTHTREFKCGGLYGNMNFAISHAQHFGIRRAIFLQDDMQFVRPLTERDFKVIDYYFASNKDVIQLQTCFIRRLSEDGFAKETVKDLSGFALFKKPELARGKNNFSDTGVFDIERLDNLFGRFAVGEGRNSQVARGKGIQLGRSLFPFMNWLPYPECHRGGCRTAVHMMIERLGGAGFHPIEIMSQEEGEAFLERDPSILPIAEAFLRSPTAPRHDIWSTGGGEYNLLARGGWPAKAFTAMRKAKHFLRCSS